MADRQKQSEKIAEIRAMSREFILAGDAAVAIGVSPQGLRIQARTAPDKLGFPVVVVGHAVRIPRIPFLRAIGIGGETA